MDPLKLKSTVVLVVAAASAPVQASALDGCFRVEGYEQIYDDGSRNTVQQTCLREIKQGAFLDRCTNNQTGQEAITRGLFRQTEDSPIGIAEIQVKQQNGRVVDFPARQASYTFEAGQLSVEIKVNNPANPLRTRRVSSIRANFKKIPQETCEGIELMPAQASGASQHEAGGSNISNDMAIRLCAPRAFYAGPTLVKPTITEVRVFPPVDARTLGDAVKLAMATGMVTPVKIQGFYPISQSQRNFFEREGYIQKDAFGDLVCSASGRGLGIR